MGNAIRFDFADRWSAYQAFDILEELGYEPFVREEGERTSVFVRVERNDITSALEIAQSFGGNYVDESRFREHSIFEQAYRMEAAEEIDIPAHLVNEDLSEDYMRGDAFSADVRI